MIHTINVGALPEKLRMSFPLFKSFGTEALVETNNCTSNPENRRRLREIEETPSVMSPDKSVTYLPDCSNPLDYVGCAVTKCTGALAAPPQPFEAPWRDRDLTPDSAAFDHAPTRRLQRGIDVLGAGFGFVHE